jgi:glycerophosphoryl diester phosphodiesterase
MSRNLIFRAFLGGTLVASAMSCSSPTRPSVGASPKPSVVTSVFDNGGRINPFRVGRPLVIPHAGGDGMFPEDTMYAFEHSIAMGGEVVDIDVWVAADGVPVAIHDPTLDRTTNGTGDVASFTSVELATLDAGWNFELDGGHPFRAKGITIPTVEALLVRFPKTLITLDMKDQRTDSAVPVCKLLQRLGRIDDVYVGSDTNDQVLSFRANCSEVHTSGTSEERQASRNARDSGDTTFRSTQLVGQPGYFGTDGKPRITATTLAWSHRSGTAILTWVIDDPKDMNDLIDMGIDGIYTRRPDVLVKLLRDRGLLPPA